MIKNMLLWVSEWVSALLRHCGSHIRETILGEFPQIEVTLAFETWSGGLKWPVLFTGLPGCHIQWWKMEEKHYHLTFMTFIVILSLFVVSGSRDSSQSLDILYRMEEIWRCIPIGLLLQQTGLFHAKWQEIHSRPGCTESSR